MRRIALFATVLLTLSSPSLADEPVCRWTFDAGSLVDSDGDAKDSLRPTGGTVRTVTDKDVPGTVGGAVAIGVGPGDAPYLVAPASDDLKLGAEYTIEAWIHPTAVGGWNRLALRWNVATGYAYHFALHDGRVSLYHGQADGSYVFAEGGHVQPNRWHHIVGVASTNASKLAVHLDGRRVATVPFNGTFNTSPGEGLGLGDSAGAPSAGSRYHGYVDELTLYRRALSPEEIAANYEVRAEILRKLNEQRRQQEIAARAEAFKRLESLGLTTIIFAERHPGRDLSGHYYANFGYACIDPKIWLHGADGGSLCRLDLRSGELTRLVDDPDGAVRDPVVHYDGRKILFSYRKGGTHHYNLYEIDVDGTNLLQLTDGPWDDVEPAYLPDGGIVFCSTRCRRYIGCWLAPSAVLHRCDGDGRNIRMLSSGNFTENTPAVLPDGRILYTRWEYVNRDPVSFHHLWTMNPDGTSQMVYFGNMHPGGVFIDARPIPGGEDVVMIHSPGHGRNEHVGQVTIVNDKHGPDERAAMRTVSRGNFRDPHPITDDTFLVASGTNVELLRGDGSTETLYAGEAMVHEPRPLSPRSRERVISPRVDPEKQTGTLVLSDVYFGRNMDGAKRGTIKELLVLEDLPKPVNYHGGGSAPIGHGVTSTIKRVLGTVPVEADGSAHFEVPAMRSVYFAALDEQGRSIKQMRSFVTVQAGETVSCVGCHEPRGSTPRSGERPALRALSRAASTIRPIEDVPDVIDFPRDVQPVLDRHCVKCHGHDRRDGGVSLVGDRGPVFSRSYYELLLFWQVKDTGGDPRHGTGRQNGNDAPRTTYSSASPLMEKLSPSHYDVRLDPREERIVRLWIDSSAQYAGTYAALGTGQVGGCWGNNEPIREMADAWPETPPAVDAIARRCSVCHNARQLPHHVTARIPLDPWGDMLSWTRPLSRYSRHRIYDLDRPADSLVLCAALSHKAGGWADGPVVTDFSPKQQVTEDRSRPPQPVKHPIVFTSTDDPDYQAILRHIETAKTRLQTIGRFDRPDFQPNEHYIREMKRYGILPAEFDPAKDQIDVYETDRNYWDAVQRP